MQKINWNEHYSTRYSEDNKRWYCQNGLEYDSKGNAMDKRAVRAKIARVADAAQSKADDAMAVAEGMQAQADSAQALLAGPDSPKTVAALKDYLDAMDIEYSTSALKPELEQLWVDAQAA